MPGIARGDSGTIFTLWPLVDYRGSEEAQYASLNLLGPIFDYQKKGREREVALRPLFYKRKNLPSGDVYSEYLFPVASRKKERDRSFFQSLHLLNSDFGAPEKEGEDEFMLFPFVFYGKSEEYGSYFALFPVGGKIYDIFGRDEIRFALFPLYGRTRKGGTTITNVLWPVFARVEGEQESGLKVWPLFGHSEKTGVYRKRFYFWPIVFLNDLRLDTDNPMRQRTLFPLYVSEESPQYSSQNYLWPLFSHVEDRKKGYEEWNLPWPLVRVTRGDYKKGKRFLPFYSDERVGEYRKRWFLWPLYKIEEMNTDVFRRRRDRVLFFLYSNLEESLQGEETPRKKRVDLWPLFTYEQSEGITHFHTLSLLEPFFPDSGGIARNWAPLWRIYQRKSDGQGNEVSSFLWNLYWKERRGENLALEVFPLFSYRGGPDVGKDLNFLKGLLRFRSGEDGRRLSLFYLPWGIPLGEG